MPPLLIELLSQFTPNELKQFDKFIQSTYFNTNKAVSTLYKSLKKYIINIRSLDDEYLVLVYQKIFPNHNISDSQLNDKQKRLFDATMSKLMALVKRFLVVEALEEKTVYRNILLHDILLEKRQLRILEINLKREKKLFQQTEHKDTGYYLHKYRLEQHQLNLRYLQGTILQQDNLPELMESFDMYYLTQQLDFQLTAITMLGASNLKKYDDLPLNSISGLLEVPQYAEHPSIRTYQVTIDMLTNDDPQKQEAAYGQLLQLLDQFGAYFSTERLNGFYRTATIFCAQRIRAGEGIYYKKMFDVYKIMEMKDLFKINNAIPIGTLKNIIAISCHAGEYEWATEKLEMYRPFIRKSVRKQVYHFNMGVIDFYQKNYKQAISHFIRVDKIDLNYDINCRVLILKSYYELDDDYDERTMQQFRSAKRFIHANKSLKINNKQGWENFITAASNLYKVRHRYGKTRLETVQKQIDNFKSINDKRWLLEKIKEMVKM